MPAPFFEEAFGMIRELFHGNAYVNTQNGLIVALACVVALVIAYRRKSTALREAEYYLSVIRTVSKALAKNQEIVAFNKNEDIVYTTHPHLYSERREFFRYLIGHITASPELKTFCKHIENQESCNVLLNKLGRGQDGITPRIAANTNIVRAGDSFVGESIVVVGMMDITRYVKDSEEKAEQYDKLEHFLDNMPLGIFYLDNDAKIIGVNTTFANIVSSSKSRVLDISITDFIDEFDAAIAAQKPTIVTVKPKFAPPFRAMLIKSAVCSISSSKQPWLIYRIIAKETAAVDADNEFLAQTTFISSQIPAAIVNARGEIRAINPPFAALIQDRVVLDKSKIIKPGTTISDLIHSSGADKDLVDQLKLALKPLEKPKPIEVQFAGGTITTNAYINRIDRGQTGQNAEQLLLIQFTDISGYKSLEQQFVQAQKMQAIGQLAGGVAHDFNNLLTAMIGFCDLLLQRYTPNDPSYADVMQIKQNAGRAAKLVKQLLAFSRQQTLVLRVISVADKLLDLSSLLKRLIGVDIDFQVIHGKNIWPIRIDSNQFEQIIINLAVNARDAMNGKGKLTIRTRNYFSERDFQCVYDTAHAGDYVLIEVLDTGCGMTKETVQHIFEPFFSQTRKTGDKGGVAGTGLGLSTVYGIINQIGGYIAVDTEPGVGSNFKLYFPRYTGPEQTDQRAKEQVFRDLSGTETILLVEDEDAVRMFSARALRDKGYKVLEASCGEEAIEIAKEHTFELLVTDVVMPKIDGPTLSNILKERSKQMKTIFVSGYTEDTFRQDVGRSSDIHFLQKPFTLKDLASKVKEVLSSGKRSL
ncbi:MAG: response regulator [Holosporales bacterium]|nr:response regulator [Holosporales bacterium]